MPTVLGQWQIVSFHSCTCVLGRCACTCGRDSLIFAAQCVVAMSLHSFDCALPWRPRLGLVYRSSRISRVLLLRIWMNSAIACAHCRKMEMQRCRRGCLAFSQPDETMLLSKNITSSSTSTVWSICQTRHGPRSNVCCSPAGT